MECGGTHKVWLGKSALQPLKTVTVLKEEKKNDCDAKCTPAEAVGAATTAAGSLLYQKTGTGDGNCRESVSQSDTLH